MLNFEYCNNLLWFLKISTCAILTKDFTGKLATILPQELQKIGKLATILDLRIIIVFKFICYYNSLNYFTCKVVDYKSYMK